jgi:hypothetical protein
MYSRMAERLINRIWLALIVLGIMDIFQGIMIDFGGLEATYLQSVSK